MYFDILMVFIHFMTSITQKEDLTMNNSNIKDVQLEINENPLAWKTEQRISITKVKGCLLSNIGFHLIVNF